MDFALLEENYVRRAYEDLKSRSFCDDCSPNAMQDGNTSKKQRLQCVVNLLKTMPSSVVLDIGRNLWQLKEAILIGQVAVKVCAPGRIASRWALTYASRQKGIGPAEMPTLCRLI